MDVGFWICVHCPMCRLNAVRTRKRTDRANPILDSFAEIARVPGCLYTNFGRSYAPHTATYFYRLNRLSHPRGNGRENRLVNGFRRGFHVSDGIPYRPSVRAKRFHIIRYLAQAGQLMERGIADPLHFLMKKFHSTR